MGNTLESETSLNGSYIPNGYFEILDLPPELRRAILIEYLKSCRMTVSVSASFKRKSLFSLTEVDGVYSGRRSGLLASCRQLRQETAELACKLLSLEVRSWGRMNLRRIGTNVPQLIRANLQQLSVVLPRDLDTAPLKIRRSIKHNKENAKAVQQFPNLRKLTIRALDIDLEIPTMQKPYKGGNANVLSRMKREWAGAEALNRYLVAANSFLFKHEFDLEVVSHVGRLTVGSTRVRDLESVPVMILKAQGNQQDNQLPGVAVRFPAKIVAHVQRHGWTLDQML